VESVSVRELKAHTSRILRELQERGQPVTVTNRGRVVARLVPERRIMTDVERAKMAAVLADMDELAAEIGAHWPEGVSAVDAVREQRREL
jgi:prevent-host-death family protein